MQQESIENQLLNEGYLQLKLFPLPSGHFLLNAELNGVPAKFILDTGAGGTVVEEKNKDQFLMETIETDETATGAGSSGLEILISDDNFLKIEGIKIPSKTILLMNLDTINNAFKELEQESVDGIMGADILTKYKAVIDYAHKKLYLKESANED